MNSWHHAVSASHKWGGVPEDYIDVEEFIDSSKKHIADPRHRAMFHHAEGIWLCQQMFGRTITVIKKNGAGETLIPVRLVAERHVLEDLGWIPSFTDYIDGMPIKTWMSGAQRKELPLSHLLKEDQIA